MRADGSDVVRTFWHGSELSLYEELSLTSFVRLGHAVQLYSYRPLRPIEGVEAVDAARILPESEVFSYADGPGKGSYAAFANLFRYKLLYDLGGIWVDTDVLGIRSMSTLPPACVAWEDQSHINCAVMRFPVGHALIKALYERALELGRGVAWGQTGPRLLTALALADPTQLTILPRETFYPVHWSEAQRLVSPQEADACEAAARSSYCLHWWNEVLRRNGVSRSEPPPTGSYLHRRACELLGEKLAATR